VISAHVLTLISFLIFVLIFRVKAYSALVQKLDDYIQSVKNRINEVESSKEDSLLALKKARADQNDMDEVIAKSKEKSCAKIRRIKSENEEYLKELEKRFQISLETRLENETEKQKGLLIERLAEQIVKRLSDRIDSSDCKVAVNFSKEDLQKLAGR
jgi:F0F1-type ATP synthase membrane subunit b/b'